MVKSQMEIESNTSTKCCQCQLNSMKIGCCKNGRGKKVEANVETNRKESFGINLVEHCRHLQMLPNKRDPVFHIY